MPATVIFDVQDRLATITLNRPEKLNAISRQLQDDLLAAIDEAEGNPAVHAVLIRGAGRAFSVGYDLTGGDSNDTQVASTQSPYASLDRDGLERFLRGWFRIWDAKLPVVSQAHGYCLAGGTQLAAICDISFVAEDCKVGTPQLPLGAGFVGVFWAWFVGPKKAKEIIMPVGMMISGREATDIGLFNQAVPAEDLDAHVQAYLQNLVRCPREVLALHKQAINRTQEIQGFREAMLQGVEVDTIAHYSPPVLAINQRIREKGLKATLAAWRAGEI